MRMTAFLVAILCHVLLYYNMYKYIHLYISYMIPTNGGEKMRRRILSIVLVLALCLAYMPAGVSAAPLGIEVTSDAELQTAFGLISATAPESPDDTITVTLAGDAAGYTYAGDTNFGNNNVVIELNNKELNVTGTITTNARLTVTGGGTLTADIAGGNDCDVIIQNGITANIGSIDMPGGTPRLTVTDSTLNVANHIIMDGTPTFAVSDSDGTIADLSFDATPANVTFTNTEMTIRVLNWVSDSSINFVNSVITIPTQLNVGYDTAPGTVFNFDDKSKIEVQNGGTFFSNTDANWFAGILNDNHFIADHFTAAGAAGNGPVTITNANDITGTARPVTNVVLKKTFEKAAYPAGTTVFEMKPYNGNPQDLFPSATEEQLGGTAYYTENVGVTVWSPDMLQETNVVTYPNAGYWIAGDAEHDDSSSTANPTVGQVGITAAEVTVTITGNHEVVAYDGAAHTATGYDVAFNNVAYDEGYVQYNGTPNPPVATTAGAVDDTVTEYMGLDAADFENTNGNFNVIFEIAEDGYITVTDLTIVTVTPDYAEKVYGDDDPAFTATVTPAIPDPTVLTYTFERDPGEDHASYVLRATGEHVQGEYYVEYAPNELTINQAQGVTVAAKADATMNRNAAVPTLYEVTGGEFKFDDEDNVQVNVTWTDPLDTATAGEYRFHITSVEFDPPTLADNYTTAILLAEADGVLTVNNSGGGGGGGGGGGDAEETPSEGPSYDFKKTDEGIGSYSDDPEEWTWGERAELPKDVADFYKVLVENSVPEEYAPTVVGDVLTVKDPNGILSSSTVSYTKLPGGPSGHTISSFLAKDSTWTLPLVDPDIPATPVDEVLVCQDDEPFYTANGDGKVDQTTFNNSGFYTVGVGTGDMKIDYPNLKTGDVVTNTTFNGVFVTKVQKGGNPTYDADLAKLKSDTIASFRAFELDHPEVFWLNGSIKLRVLTVTINGVQYAHIFMTLVDDGGFTMRIVEYAAAGAIEAAIQQRDAAVNAIIAQIPAGLTNRQKVVNLNKWFTLNNEYNRSADLTSIGYTPHRALKSLMGNFGINGPVCDGYSRGFKTVCDRLGIPVLLDTGVASIGAHSELHMWMRIQVDGVWYGTDCTWDDPIVKGKDGKVSGYENEKYLLVGDDTVVDGAKFGISHPHNNTPGGVTGVLFASLVMNTDAINGYTPLDFEDVRLSDWFYDYVQSAVKKGLMGGTAENIFSPLRTATRGQIVQILYNAAGQPDVDEVKVEGWYGKAATWAMNKGIVAGYSDGKFHGDDSVTREQLATILWAFDGAPEQSGELDFADADKVSAYAVQPLLWAKNKGIIGGKPGNLADPQGTATRAEIATIFSNYIQ